MKIFLSLLLSLCLMLQSVNKTNAQACTAGTTSCPTAAPSPSSVTVCQGAPAPTFNANPLGVCPTAPACCYNAPTSNLSIQIAGTHTFLSDLTFWVLNGTGPQGAVSIILYNGRPGSNAQPDPVAANNYASSCNSGDNFNLTFSFAAGAVMPSICTMGAPLVGTHLPESPEANLNGINFSAYSWTVRIFDCIGGDAGVVTSGQLTITETSCNDACTGCGGGPLAGTFSAALSGSGTINDNSCTAASASSIAINPPPPPTRTVEWYSVATGGAPLATNNTFTPTDVAPGTYTYYAEVNCGGNACVPCTGGVCGSADPRASVTYVINPAPLPVSVTSNAPICAGDDLVLNATTASPSAGVTFAWTGPNGFTSTVEDPTIAAITTAGAGTYSVTVSATEGGCNRTSTASVVINPSATPPSPVVGGSICQGAAVTPISATCAACVVPGQPGGQQLLLNFGEAGWTAAGNAAITATNCNSGTGIAGVLGITTGAASVTYTGLSLPGNTTCGAYTISFTADQDNCAGVNAGSTGPEPAEPLTVVVGSNSYTVSVTNSGPFSLPPIPAADMAAISTITFSVNVNDPTWDAFSIDNLTFTCAAIPPTSTPATVNWYDAVTGGTLQGTGSTLDPAGKDAEEGGFDNFTPGLYTFYSECVCSGCPSTRTPVVFEVRPLAAAFDYADACPGFAQASTQAYSGGTQGPGLFSMAPPIAGVSINPTSGLLTYSGVACGSAGGTTTITYTPSGANPCVFSDQVTITAPACPPTTTSVSVCQGDVVPNVTAAGSACTSVATVCGADPCTAPAACLGPVATAAPVPINNVQSAPATQYGTSPATIGVATTPVAVTLTPVVPPIAIPACASNLRYNYTISYTIVTNAATTSFTNEVRLTSAQIPGLPAGALPGTTNGPGTINGSSTGTTTSLGAVTLNVNDTYNDNGATFDGTITLTYTIVSALYDLPTLVTPPPPPPTPSSITWWDGNGPTATQVGTGVTFTPPISSATPGTYTFYASAACGGCQSARAPANVIVVPRPAAPQPQAAAICQGGVLPTALALIGSSPSNGADFNVFDINGTQIQTGVGSANLTLSTIPVNTAGVYIMTYTQEVTVGALTCESAPATITVTINAAPVTPVINSNSPVCAGDDLLLSSGPAPGGLSYQWSGPSGWASTNQNPIRYNITTTGAGAYNLTVTNSNGCTATAPVHTVVVNTVSAIVADLSASVCSGNSSDVALSIPVVLPVGGTYYWTGPNGYSTTSGTPIVTTADINDNGYYQLLYTSPDGCTVTAGTHLDVNETPLPLNITTNSPVCEGEDLIITTTNATEENALYTWSGPAGVIINNSPILVIPAALVANGGNYTATVTVDDLATGLENDCTVSASINTIVYPAITVTIANNATLCAAPGATFTLTATAVGAAASYNWAGPGGYTAITTTNTVTLANVPSSNGTYSVQATTANGCVSPPAYTTLVASNAITVTAGVDQTICNGNTVVLSATSVPGASFNWYRGSIGTANFVATGTSTISVAPTATTTYFVEAIYNGCTATDNTIITVNPTPTVTLAQAGVCGLATATLTATGATGAAPYTYSFAGPSGFAASNTTGIVTVPNTPINNGTYSVFVTDAVGCISLLAYQTLSLGATPVAVATNDGPVCAGSSVNLFGNPVAGANYEWHLNTLAGALLGTSQNLSVPVTNATTTYVLQVTYQGCPTSAATTVTVNQNPTVAPTFTAPSCTNALTALTLTSGIAGGTAPYTFTWNGPLGYTFVGATNPIVIPSASTSQSGVYSVTAVDANGCTSATQNMVVSVQPAITVSASAATVCQGTSATVTATTMQNGVNVSGANYYWYSDAALTVLVGTGQNYTTPALAATTTFFVNAAYNGCEVSTSSLITVNANPSVILANNYTCVSATVSITATAVPAGAYTYYFTGPNGYSNTNNTGIITLNNDPINNGTYSVYIVNASGCSSNIANNTVVLGQTPPAVATNNGPICAGASVTLNGNPVVGATYEWRLTDGSGALLGTSQNLVIPSLSSTTVYFLRVTSNGCSNTTTTTVTVNQNPTVAPTNTAGLCRPIASTFTLTSGAAIGLAPFGYFWSGPSGFTSSLATPILPNLPINNGMYSVYVIDANGCTSALGSTFVIASETVATPTANNNSPVCLGATVTLTTGNVVGASYQWVGPAGFASTAQNPTLVPTASGIYSLTISINGCTSPVATTTVIVNPNPTVAPTNTAGLCRPIASTFTLTSGAAIGLAPFSYFWSGPNGFTSSLATPILPNLPVNNGMYSVYVIDANGCASALGSTFAIASETVATPTANNNSPVCLGATVTLTTGSIMGASYVWTGPAGFVSTSQNPTLVPAATGTYSLTISINGCTSLVVTTLVTINPHPDVTLPAITTTCSGYGVDVILNGTINDGTAPFTYIWNGPSGFTAAVEDPTIFNVAAGDEGTYTFQVIDANGCASDIASTDLDINPTPGFSYITSTGPICEGEHLEVSTIYYADPGTIYSWTFNGVAIGPNSPVLIFDPATVAMTGTYGVTITFPNAGTCPPIVASIAVVVNARPVITSVNAGASPYCSGTSTNITVSAVVTNTPVGATFAWTGPNGYSSSGVVAAANSIPNAVIPGAMPIHSGAYTLTVTSAVGCLSASVSVYVQVRPTPAQPTITSNQPICEDDRFELFTQLYTGGTVVYTWYQNGTGLGNIIATSNTPYLVYDPVTLGQNGTYFVQVTVDGCPSVISPLHTVVVYNKPIIVLTSPNQILCEEEDIIIEFTVTPAPAAGSIYHWSGPNGWSSTQAISPIVIPTPTLLNDGSYTLYIETPSNCNAEAVSIYFDILDRPAQPTVTSNEPICEDGRLELFTQTYSGVLVTYTWYQNGTGLGNIIATSNTPYLVYDPVSLAQNGTYYVQVTVDGCTSTMSPLHTVVVYDKPLVTLSSFDQSLCEEQDIVINFTVTPAPPVGSIYHWSGPNGWTSNQSTSPITVGFTTLLNDGTYSLYIETPSNCNSEPVGLYFDMIERPAQPIVTNNGPVCEGEELIINTSVYPGFFTLYQWTTPLGPITTSVNTITYTDATMAQNGNYSLQVVVDGCQSQPATPVPAIVYLTPTVEAVSNTGIYCSGAAVDIILLATVNDVPVGSQFTWSGPMGYTYTAFTTVINTIPSTVISGGMATHSGAYSLQITSPDACASNVLTTYVLVKPEPTQPVVYNNGPLCAGERLEISTTAQYGTFVTYNWFFNGTAATNLIASTSAPYLTYDPSATSQQGTYFVQVIVDGCVSTMSPGQLVIVYPTPAAPTLSNTGPYCSGTTIQLNATNGGGLFPFGTTFAWTGPAGFASTIQNPTIPFSTITNSGAYILTVTSANDCTSQLSSTFVTVKPQPAQPFITNNGPVCEGEHLEIQTNVYYGTVVTYNWTTPSGLIITNTPYLVYEPSSVTQNGNYSVSVTVDGCTSTTSPLAFVTVYATPAIPIVSNTGPYCNGANIQLIAGTNSGANFAAGTQFFWSGPNGFVSSLEDPVIANVTTVEDGIYTLYIESASGCASGIAITEVIVYGTPTIPFITQNGPLCEGNNLVLNSTFYPGGTVNYQWFHNGLSLGTTLVPYFTINNVNNSNSGIYNIQVTVDGCISNISYPTTVVVTPTPATPILFTNDNTNLDGDNINTFCEGEMIQLSALNGAAAYMADAFAWTGPNGYVNTAMTPLAFEATNISAGVYYLTVYNNGCASTVASINIEVNEIPAMLSIATNSPLCAGDILTLTASPAISSGNYTWTNHIGSSQFVFATATPTLSINPGGSGYASGTWSVYVATGSGCQSMESNLVSVVVNSIPTIPTAENSGAVCDGGDITLFTPAVAGALYQWSGPSGYTSAAQSPVLNDVTAAMNGSAYSVITTVNGCSSLASPSTIITVFAIPITPILTSSSPVCENTTLNLVCSTVYPAGATYQWFGPAAFTSNLQNPTIATATMSQNGSYICYVTLNGCTSLAGSVEVAINAQPVTPLITSSNIDGIVCESNNIQLTTSIATGIDVTYTWFYDADGAGPALPSSVAVTNVAEYEFSATSLTNEGYYSVVTTIEGCASLMSAYYFVDVVPTLSTPNIASNAPICAGTTLQLTSTTLADSYLWSGPSGFISTLQNPMVVADASSFNAGNYTLVTTINGCSSTTATTTVVINELPTSPLIISNSPVCSGLPLIVTATGVYATGTTFVWHLPNGTIQTTTTNVLTVAAPAPAGLYTVDALSGSGCISAPTTNDFNGDGLPDNQTLTVTDIIPSDAAYAGNDISVCAGSDATALSATSIAGGGYWSFAAGSPTCTVVNPSFNNTILDDLQPGTTYNLVWNSNNGACGVYDSDTVSISVYATTLAAQDTFFTYETDLTAYFDVLSNDALAGNATVSIITINSQGSVSVNADNTINYTAPDGWIGSDSIEYKVCLTDCPTMCSTAWLIVTILPRVPDCELPNIITPNNDGTNDMFDINCQENYPNGKMDIYNRWGNIVFTENPYSNSWTGTYETLNGSDLPDGTYFYVWTNMDNNVILAKGFITIIR